MTLIRYPGAKDSEDHIRTLSAGLPRRQFALVEPFAGTAAIAFYALRRQRLTRLWLNDIDAGIIDMWRQVKEEPRDLIEKVRAYQPSTNDFYEWRNDCTDGFRKLVLHQISYNGLGAKAGSPIGGREQCGRGGYKVDCRWSPHKLEEGINRCSKLLNSVPVKLTTGSWEQCKRSTAFAYLDPPYVGEGPNLYVSGMVDHTAIADWLRTKEERWLVSYDDCPTIRGLYEDWARIEPISVTSKMSARKIADVAILPR